MYLVLLLVLFLVWYWWFASTYRRTYHLIAAMNYVAYYWRQRQNEELRTVAAPHQGPTPFNSGFGIVPGLCPAAALEQVPGLNHIYEFNRCLIAKHNQIAGEIGMVLRKYGGVPTMELDQRQSESFGDVLKWKSLWVYFFGDYGGVSSSLPTLTNIVRDFQQYMSVVMISILPADTHIPPHTGPMMNVIRYHYGLSIPVDELGTGLRINGEFFRWQNKLGVIFDDTYLHEAWNKTSKLRIVIFCDFYRPFPPVLSWVNRLALRWIRKSQHIVGIQKRLAQEGKSFD